MNKTTKKFAVIAMAAIMLAPAFVFLPANAQDDSALWGNKKDAVKDQMGAISGSERDPREIMAAAINVLMGFLGIIAVLIILFGGFKWMTAQGAEDKIDDAKKLLAAGVIGLVIILSSWALANFVLTQVMQVSGNGATG